jgi:hypothetical protein
MHIRERPDVDCDAAASSPNHTASTDAAKFTPDVRCAALIRALLHRLFLFMSSATALS